MDQKNKAELTKMIIDKLVMAVLAAFLLGAVNYCYWKMQSSHDNNLKRIDQKIETASVIMSELTNYLTFAEELARNGPAKQNLRIFIIKSKEPFSKIVKASIIIRTHFSKESTKRYDELIQEINNFERCDGSRNNRCYRTSKDVDGIHTAAKLLRDSLVSEILSEKDRF